VANERVALITGASAGIGLATGIALARRGFSLRIVGRDPAKLEAARAEIARHGSDVVGFRADLSSLADVRALAASVLARGEALHVLVNNAGVWHPDFRRSKDGWEDTFAVNHLAPFLLTHLLLPRMRETPGDRRIVHVSSRLHAQAGEATSLRGRVVHVMNIVGLRARARGARFDFDALDRAEGYRGIEAYARSKLAQVIFSAELARREREVTSNAVHPGSVATDVTRDNPLLYAVQPLSRLVLKTPAQGAATSVHVATAPALAGVSGRYFANSREATPADIASDRDVAARLWALSAERVGLPADPLPPGL
jgi:NAD(P)-dependent dehydrogenase (short-subunit alcohol dehydrogenase family)